MTKKVYQKAITAFQKAIALDPSKWWTYMRVSHAYEGLGNIQQAKLFLQKGYEIDPTDPDVLKNYATGLYQLKEYSEAMTYFERGIEMNEDNFQLKINYIIILANTNYEEQAIKHLEKLYEEHGKTVFGNFFAAYIYALIDKTAVARTYLDKAFEIAPQEPYNYLILAAIEEFDGNTELFYTNVDLALAKGFNEEGILDERPFKNYKNDERYTKILKKHNWLR